MIDLVAQLRALAAEDPVGADVLHAAADLLDRLRHDNSRMVADLAAIRRALDYWEHP